MGQFTPTLVADGNVVDPAVFNQNMQDIEAANNEVNDGDIPNDEIAVAKLSEKYSIFTLEMAVASIAAGAVMGTIQDNVPIPFGDADTICYKVAVTVVNWGGGGPSPSVDVYKKSTGASILGAPITIGASDIYYESTPTVQSMATGDHYTLRVAIPGAGPMLQLKVVLLCKTLLKS